MDNYQLKVYRNSFDELVEYFGSDTALSHYSGDSDENTFGDLNSNSNENVNNPIEIAILLPQDDGFNTFVSSVGHSEDVQAIAVFKYSYLDLIPYNLTELSDIAGDTIEENGLNIKYKFTGDYSFYKIGDGVIGLIFSLSKV